MPNSKSPYRPSPSKRSAPKRSLNLRIQTLPRGFFQGRAKQASARVGAGRDWDNFHFDPTPFPADSLINESVRDARAHSSSEAAEAENTYAITWLEFELKPLPDSSFFQNIDEVAIDDLYSKHEHAGQEQSTYFQDRLLVARTALTNRLMQREKEMLHRHNSPVSSSAVDLSSSVLSSSESPSLSPDDSLTGSGSGSSNSTDSSSAAERDRGRFRTFFRATMHSSRADFSNQLLLSDYVLIVNRKGELVPQLLVISSNAVHLTAARTMGSIGAFQRTRQIWFENVRGVSLLSRNGSNFFVLHVFKGLGRIRSRTDYLIWSARKSQLLVALSVAIRNCLNIPLRAAMTNQLQILNSGFVIDLRVVDLPHPDLPSKVRRHANSLQSFQTIETTITVSRPVREQRPSIFRV